MTILSSNGCSPHITTRHTYHVVSTVGPQLVCSKQIQKTKVLISVFSFDGGNADSDVEPGCIADTNPRSSRNDLYSAHATTVRMGVVELSRALDMLIEEVSRMVPGDPHYCPKFVEFKARTR